MRNGVDEQVRVDVTTALKVADNGIMVWLVGPPDCFRGGSANTVSLGMLFTEGSEVHDPALPVRQEVDVGRPGFSVRICDHPG